jgi:hypothetical protein
MTFIVPSSAGTGNYRVYTINGSGTSSNNDVTFAVTATVTVLHPILSYLSPSSGLAGASVTVYGSNFSSANRAYFDSTSISFSVNSSGSLTFTVPSSATVGNHSFKIIDADGSDYGSNSSSFTVTAPITVTSTDTVPRPMISSLSPTSGPTGTLVTMYGTNFNSNSKVYFGTIVVNPTSVSSESLTFTVPSSATLSTYYVYTTNGSDYSSNGDMTFTVTAASVSSVSETSQMASVLEAMKVTLEGIRASLYR